jgi:hypothetical protein
VPQKADPLQVIDEIEPLREALRGFVAAFMADGFTEAQARELVIFMFRQQAQNPS